MPSLIRTARSSFLLAFLALCAMVIAVSMATPARAATETSRVTCTPPTGGPSPSLNQCIDTVTYTVSPGETFSGSTRMRGGQPAIVINTTTTLAGFTLNTPFPASDGIVNFTWAVPAGAAPGSYYAVLEPNYDPSSGCGMGGWCPMSSPGRINIVVAATPPAPTAGNVSASTPYQTAASIALAPAGSYTSVEKLSDPANGTVTISGTTATYTPNAGFYGTNSFTYRAVGPGGNSAAATVTVTVGLPPPPGAGNVSATTPYQTAASIPLSPNSGSTSVELVTQPANGSASISGWNAVFTPTAGFYGTTSFTYRAVGPGGGGAPATVTVTVSPPPAPTAGNVTTTTTYQTAKAIPLTPGGVYSSVAVVTQPPNGAVTISGTTATYTPDAGYYGSDSFTYRSVGPGGNSAAATVTVTVGLPPAPTAGNVTTTTTYQTAKAITLTPAGVYSTLSLNTAPANGNVVISGTTATYTPAAGFYGTNSFTYFATGPGGNSAPATVTVTVGLPPAPTAGNVSASTPYQTAASIALTPAGVYSSVQKLTDPANGTVTISGTTATYTPAAGFYGTNSFTYRAVGPGGNSAAATVTVTVGLPPAPTAGNVSASTPYQTAASIALTPSGVYSSVQKLTDPANGTVTISGTTATYTPAAGFYGTNSFTYRAVGPGGNSAAATVTVTVGLPPAPTAGDVNALTPYQTAATIPLSASGVYSAIQIVAQPGNGSATAGSNAATYTPAAGFYGLDTFTYRAVGPGGNSPTRTVSVLVGNPPAPTAGNVSATTPYQTAASIALTPAGVYSSVQKLTDPANGTVTISGTSATYTPAAGFYGVNTFTYQAVGPGGNSAPATVTVTVSVPPPPTANNTTLSTAFQTQGSVALPVAGVLTAVNIVGQPSNGSASITGTTLTYTPAAGFHGTDILTYNATGPGGASPTRTVTITVAVPAAPTLTGGPLTTAYETAGSRTLTATGYSPVLAVGTAPAHGAVSISGLTVTYTPAAGYYGADAFTVTATNAGGTSAPATVSVTVGLPPAPTAGAVSATTPYETPRAITLTPGGVYSSVEKLSDPANGTVSISGTTATYTPAAGFYGVNTFTYRAVGPGGNSAAATVTVTVAVPPAPVANDATMATAFQTQGTTVLPVSGVLTTVNIIGQPAHGSASITGTTLTYTPAAGYYGADALTYRATGPGGASDTRAVAITVAVPAAPTVAGGAISTDFETPASRTLAVSGFAPVLVVSSAPANGTVSISGATVTYTPDDGYYGADSFAVTANNAGGVSAPATVTVTVGLPPKPTIAPASITTAYDAAGSVSLAASGVYSSVRVASDPTNGSVSLAGMVLTYTPNVGYFGSDSLTVEAVGPGGVSDAATVTVNVGLPGAPSVASASITAPYDQAGGVDLAVSGVYSAVEINSVPAHGVAVLNGDRVTYTPTTGYYGADSFTVRAVGPGGNSAPATVTVTVGLPPAPVAASALSLATAFETPGEVTLTATGVVTSYGLVTQPANGAAVRVGDRVTYTPAAGFFGTDSFTYRAVGPGGNSAPATVTVTVGLPPVPVADAATISTPFETVGSVNLQGSGIYSSYQLVDQAANGTATISGGVASYTPAGGYYGADSFTFTVTGPGGVSAPATVTVNVGLPGKPVASPDSISTDYETAGSATLRATGVHDAFAVTAQPTHGTVSISGATATYTPAAGYYGPDAFTFTASGPGGVSNPATVAVTVALPPAPDAGDVSAATPYQTAASIALTPSGVYTSVVKLTDPANGAVTISGTTATFTPNAGFYGVNSFTYRAVGPGGNSAPATVTVSVGLPPVPVANAASISTPFETVGTANLQGSGVYSSYQLVGQPANGTATISGGVASYTPASGFFGTDAFTFTVTGPGGVSAPATVSVTVGLPGKPVASPDSITTAYETVGSVTLRATGVHDTFAITSDPTHGTVSINGATATYTPAPAYYGADAFTFTASGPGGVSNPATVAVTVGLPAKPVPANQSVQTPFATAAVIDLGATGVWSSFAVAAEPRNGTVTISGGQATYTPNAGYFGADNFTFRAIGPGGTSNPATVNIVVGLPAAPTVEAAVLLTGYETPGSLQLPVQGVTQRVFITQGAHGTVTIVGTTATYAPRLGFYGTDTFTYRASGPGGDSVWATVTVTVGLPAAPTVSDTTLATAFQMAKSVVLPAQGVLTTVNVVGPPSHGSASITGTTLTYTPAAGFYGADSLTFSATGPGGTSSVATLTIVVGTPNAPAIGNLTMTTPFGQAVTGSFSITGFSPVLDVASAPQNGTAVVGGQYVTYTPKAGFYGQDTFTVTARNAGGVSAPATVTVNVGLPGAPVLPAASLTTAFETAGTVELAPTGVYSSVAIVNQPANGTATIDGLRLTVTPRAGFYGADSVRVRAIGPGGNSATVTVAINVGLPGAPSVSAATLNTGYETAGTVQLVGAGVFDRFEIVTTPGHGAASLTGNTLRYVPAGLYYGADTVTVRAVGPGGASAPATVTVNVGLPGAPVAQPVNLAAVYETAGHADLTATGVFSGFVLDAPPAHGRAEIASNRVTYTPDAGFFGQDTFTYRAVGPGGNSTPAPVSVTVGLPGKPVALAGTIDTPFETVGTVRLTASGVHSSVAIAAQPTNGTVVLVGDEARYTPAPGYFGSDAFTFTATGPGGTSAPATVSVTVGLPGKPVASPGSIQVPYETAGAATLRATGIFDGFAITTAPEHGRVEIEGDKATYTPNTGYYGSDSFAYVAQGPGGASNPAVIAVTVGLPAVPTVEAAAITTAYETPGTVTLVVAGVFADVELMGDPANGRATLNGLVLTYTPDARFFGTDTLRVRAVGPGGASALATVTVTVAPPAAPTVEAAAITTAYETPGTASLVVNGVFTDVELVGEPTNGDAVLNGLVVTYTPDARFYGADALRVRAVGPGGVSQVVTVAVTVGLPPSPVLDAADMALSTPFGTPVGADLTASGVLDGFELASEPANGTAGVSGARVTYTPAADFYGVDRFTYVAVGPGGKSAPRDVVVTVGVPAPTALDVAATTTMNVAAEIDLAADVAHAQTAEVVTQPVSGTVTVAGTTATYTPAAGFYGTDTFTFTLTGVGGVSDLATATVTVEGGPPPEADDLEKTGLSGQPIVFDVTENMEGGPFQAVRLIEGGGTSPQSSHGGTVVVDGLRVIFTPGPEWTGTASFRFAVQNRYGWSEPAMLRAVVNPRPATGPVIELETWAGVPVEVMLTDEASGGPFLAANVESITPSEGVDVVVTKAGDGYSLRATPRGQFAGVAEIRYTLRNAFAVSEPGLVRLTVKERPDPSRDPEVSGLVNAQTQAAYRFSSVQTSNVLRRLEQLHGDGPRRNHVGLTLVPMTELEAIPGENEAMREMREYMVRAGMVEHGPNGDRQQEQTPAAAGGSSESGRLAWWMEGAVDLGFKRRDEGREGFNFTTDGLTVGADAKVSDKLTVGLGAGYGRDESDVGKNGTVTAADAYSGFAYASWLPRENLFVDGVLGFTSMSYDATRYVTETGGMLASQREGHQVFGAISAGYEHRGRRLHWSPYARVEFADVTLGGFRETGDDLWALDFAEQHSSQVRAALGVHGDYLFAYRSGDLKPSFRVEYTHDLKNGGTAGVRYAEWLESPEYGIELAPYDDQNLKLGVGVDWVGANGVALGVSYEGTVLNHTGQEGRLRLNLSVKF